MHDFVGAFNPTISGLETRKRKGNLAEISGEQHNHMTCAHKRPQLYPEPDRIKDTDGASLLSHHTSHRERCRIQVRLGLR